jgi:isocitrate dehydrogenase
LRRLQEFNSRAREVLNIHENVRESKAVRITAPIPAPVPGPKENDVKPVHQVKEDQYRDNDNGEDEAEACNVKVLEADLVSSSLA